MCGPNQALQQTGHAIDGFFQFSANSRVSRLLSYGVRRIKKKAIPCSGFLPPLTSLIGSILRC